MRRFLAIAFAAAMLSAGYLRYPDIDRHALFVKLSGTGENI